MAPLVLLILPQKSKRQVKATADQAAYCRQPSQFPTCSSRLQRDPVIRVMRRSGGPAGPDTKQFPLGLSLETVDSGMCGIFVTMPCRRCRRDTDRNSLEISATLLAIAIHMVPRQR